MSVHTVIFDAGFTLLGVQPSFWEVFVSGADDVGIEIGEVEPTVALRDTIGHLWRAFDDDWYDRGNPSPHIGDDDAEFDYWHGLYRSFFDHLEVDGDRHAAAVAVHHRFMQPGTFRPFDDVHDNLDALRSAGVRLGLLSNWAPWLRTILDHEDLTPYFEAIVVSGEEGIVKPDERIFRATLDRMGLQPNPAVSYVGDDVHADYEPSIELGLTPVLIDRFGRNEDFEGRRITSLDELAPALGIDGIAA